MENVSNETTKNFRQNNKIIKIAYNKSNKSTLKDNTKNLSSNKTNEIQYTLT